MKRCLRLLFVCFAGICLAQDKPNVVLIIADDVSPDFSCFGGQVQTPHIDQLAAQGVRFDNAYVTASSCSPSRSSMITGRYPHNTGAPELHMDLPEGQFLFPLELKKAGYYCAQYGKWHMGDYAKQAFDVVQEVHYPDEPTGAKGWVPLLQNRPKDKPFFMWFAAFDAHRPWEADELETPHDPAALILPAGIPDTPASRADLAAYCDEVRRFDRYVGDVVTELKSQGVLDNTLIILLGDNGRPFARSKTSLYDSGMKTPLVVHWPNGKLKAGAVSKSLVSAIDIAPAILETAGLPVPAQVQGISLLPVCRSPELKTREILFGERNWHTQIGCGRMVRKDDWVYMRDFTPGFFSFQMVDYKYGSYAELLRLKAEGKLTPEQAETFSTNRPPEQLFNVAYDPQQLVNLVDHPEQKERLAFFRMTLADWQQQTGDSIPAVEEMTPDRQDRETNERFFPGLRPPTGMVPGQQAGAANLVARAGGSQDLAGTRYVYKQVDGRDLSLYITRPDGWKAGDSRPAVVFFHGGGWTKGEPNQFTEHSTYLASRGMVCVQVQYRLIDKKIGETPMKCIQDAKSAMRWVRSRAKELGIDPDRMASGGGSAGGHLAAFVGMVDGMDDPQDDLGVSAKSNAMLLFNPVLDNGPNGYGHGQIKESYPDYSPFHNVTADDPPAIFFLGDQDVLIPVETAYAFQRKMNDAGVACEVMVFEGMPHSFFNYDRYEHVPYYKTMVACDRFLAGLGWLEGEPTITELGIQTANREQGPSPEAVLAGFEQRIDAIFKAEAGKPLVRAKKQPPLKKGSGNFTREYSYSIVSFAARCLYLNEQIDEANAALVENAQHYLDNPLDILDRDSFHWHADIVMRLVEMYGSNGTKNPGLLTPETEDKVLQPIWLYAKEDSWLGKADIKKSKTWNLYESENHHAMDFATSWHFSKLAKDRPEYRNLKYNDGAIAAEHYKAWNDYIVAYCLERARKSLCVEMRSDGYNTTMLRVFYNFYDFGEPRVRRAAGQFIDLYLAYWAEEQINGLMGGGGSRVRGNNAYRQSRTHNNAALAWYYFGIGQPPEMHGKNVNAMLSDYRPPAVVADIAIDFEGRGRYEIRQRTQGLGKVIGSEPSKMTALRTDGGGILRYSYCDPAFIIGTPMTEARPLEDWAPISSQSRWQGVVFAGEHDPRIVPFARPSNSRDAMNAQWSVQSKGSLITQKLKTSSGAAEMIAWISPEGLSAPVREGDTVFVEAPGAYAAVRVTRGDFSLEENKQFNGEKTGGSSFATPPGQVVTPDDEYTPVILEVMAKSDVENFEAFKAKVRACKIRFDGSVLKYTTIYGDTLTFDTSYLKTPTINGAPVDYAPKRVFDSPFLSAEYNRGVVTIQKGSRSKVLDFTK